MCTSKAIPPNDSVMTNTSDLVQTKSSSASISSRTTSDSTSTQLTSVSVPTEPTCSSVRQNSVPVHIKSPIPPNDSVMTNTSDLVQTKSSSTSVSSKTTMLLCSTESQHLKQ